MNIIKKIIVVFLFLTVSSNADGQKVFKDYCWGCHHQTAQAFGPSFKQIANTRSKDQIITHIASPKSDFKQLGYKRSVMPAFGTTLTKDELDQIVQFIYSCKDMK
jgi:mono/diheme cytochrome c family protein